MTLANGVRSVLALALGATSLTAVMVGSAAWSPAHAVVACSPVFTGFGANTLATATQVPGRCLTTITGNQGFDGYWEFAFSQQTSSRVSAIVQGGNFGSFGSFSGVTGYFFGSLDLYKDNGGGSYTNVSYSAFAPRDLNDVLSGTSYAALDPFTFLANQNYIIGIEASPTDPPFTISFDAVNVPEPSTMSLLGVAGMALAFIRRRRTQS